MEILIIKLGAMGDVLRTTSILKALKEKYIDVNISWITKEESIELLKNNKYIDDLYTYEKLRIDDLKNNSYDLIISLDDDKEICQIVVKLKKEKLVGAYFDNGKCEYTEDSSPWFAMGLISKYGKERADELKARNKKTYQEILFSILELKNSKKYLPILTLEQKYIDFAIAFAARNGIIKGDTVIGINTGAGGRWQDKKLSIKETVELINGLNWEEKDVKILLFGGSDEGGRNNNIINLVKNKIINCGCNNSLMEFASLVNLCNIIVTSDSLAMHIGIALKKKILAFFYPTSAKEIELYGSGIKIIGKGNSYCSYETKSKDPPTWDIDKFITSVKRLVEK